MKKALIASYIVLVAVVLFTPQMGQSEPQHRVVIRSMDMGDHQIVIRDGERVRIRSQFFDVDRDRRFRDQMLRVDPRLRLPALHQLERLERLNNLRLERLDRLSALRLERLERLDDLRLARLDRLNRLNRLNRFGRDWRDEF